MTRPGPSLYVYVFAIGTGCTRAIAPGDPPRAPGHEEASELDRNASVDDVAGDAGAFELPDACAPDDPIVTVRARFATYVSATAPNIGDATFTGPRAAAHVQCAAFLASNARDRSASNGVTIYGKVLRRCDERPLPPVVRGSRTRVELVRESSSGAGGAAGILDGLVFLHDAPRSCIEATVASARVDRHPFDSFDACETIRTRLEAKDREAAAGGRHEALAWLDGQIATIDEDLAKAREALAADVARSKADAHEKRDRVEQEMRRMSRERLERDVRSRESFRATALARRDQAANEPIVIDVKGTCVVRGER